MFLYQSSSFFNIVFHKLVSCFAIFAFYWNAQKNKPPNGFCPPSWVTGRRLLRYGLWVLFYFPECIFLWPWFPRPPVLGRTYRFSLLMWRACNIWKCIIQMGNTHMPHATRFILGEWCVVAVFVTRQRTCGQVSEQKKGLTLREDSRVLSDAVTARSCAHFAGTAR